uniref:Uncharacterized protein n=1 Tax=Cannabis sativa TaxID=3483 RepID=A0A803P6N5_CANSA
MAHLGGGAEAHARFKQYEYRANSSLERRPPELDEKLKKSKEKKKKERDPLAEPGLPRTKETRAAYEAMLSVIQQQLGGQPLSIVFDQLVSIGRLITDFQDGSDAADSTSLMNWGMQMGAGVDDDDNVEANEVPERCRKWCFGILAEKDDMELKTNWCWNLSIRSLISLNFCCKSLKILYATRATAKREAKRTWRRVLLEEARRLKDESGGDPERSRELTEIQIVTSKGMKKIHVPALKPKPFDPEEKLIKISSMPEWAQPAFRDDLEQGAEQDFERRQCQAIEILHTLRSCKSNDLKDLVPYGLQHHAGLNRLTTACGGSLFADGHIQVFKSPCYSLAWDVVDAGPQSPVIWTQVFTVSFGNNDNVLWLHQLGVHAKNEKPAIVYVPTRKHVRLTAMDLMTYSNADGGKATIFVKVHWMIFSPFIDGLQDEMLKVTEPNTNDGVENVHTDYPSDLLQMMGHANSPVAR